MRRWNAVTETALSLKEHGPGSRCPWSLVLAWTGCVTLGTSLPVLGFYLAVP